jgi:lipoprotein-anchoring transpeptidase ErfK/SrfK
MNRRYYPLALLLFSFLLLLPTTLTSAQQDCVSPDECGGSKALGITDEVINAHPEPEVESLPINEKLLYDRWYQQVKKEKVDVYNAPNGTVVRSIEAGFNFVTSLTNQDGWTEINNGEWIEAKNLTNSNGIISHFSGVMLPDKPLLYPMAWALINFHPSKEPGGKPVDSNPLIYRYTRLNLYSSVEVNGEIWYQIGINQWAHQFNVAKIIPVERPKEIDTKLWISIDLFEQVVIAYDGTMPVFASLVSSGLPRWETREGLYHIYYRHLREEMHGGNPGDDFYSLEEVPWTMFFDEGRALHGAYWHDGFGYRRSHGCVNLSITDAKWLYDWVANAMGSRSSADRENGPAVYIYSSGQYR